MNRRPTRLHVEATVLTALLAVAPFALTSAVPPRADAAGRDLHTEFRNRPPRYVGKAPAAKPAVRPAHLPLALGPALRTGALGVDAEMGADLARALAQAAEALDGFGVSRALAPVGAGPAGSGPAGVDSMAVQALLAKDAPEILVSVPDGTFAPLHVPGVTEEDIARAGREATLVHVMDPPSAWKKQAGALAVAVGADHVLVVTLDRSDYPVAQKNLKGSKAVELGTNDLRAVPWLTSLDQPVEVLHFSGALYRSDGRFVRAGAEGFAALRTPFLESVAGVQRTLTREALAAAWEARREDLPGSPRAWEVALRTLVAQLTGTVGTQD